MSQSERAKLQDLGGLEPSLGDAGTDTTQRPGEQDEAEAVGGGGDDEAVACR